MNRSLLTLSRSRRLLVAGICVVLGGIAALVWAIQTKPDFGPWLADTVRAAVGPRSVARGEEAYYAVLDGVNRWRYQNAAPANMWDRHTSLEAAAVPVQTLPTEPVAPGIVPSAQNVIDPNVFDPNIGVQNAVVQDAVVQDAVPLAVTPVPNEASQNESIAPASDGLPPIAVAESAPVFLPTDFAPPLANVAAVGDGVWEPWDAGPVGTQPLLYRTQVHTDPARPQSVVAVVAMDLHRLKLQLVPGVREPITTALQSSDRTGLVPEWDRPLLVAAFNGGWQTIHGHLGMKVGAIELLPPVEWGCTLAMLANGSVRIAGWPSVKPDYDTVQWMRQTPPCLVENGKEDERLEDATLRWGAALNGRTVVRRSALGINADGSILYYAIGDSLTSAAIARGLEAAGAVSAAMLDINQAFPRFVTFRTTANTEGWLDHLPVTPQPPDIYLGTPANKDFFYLMLR